MESWVIEGLSRVVGRTDRMSLPEIVPDCVERREGDGLVFYRVVVNGAPLGRGMVVSPEGVVPDYARVRRVFRLSSAARKYYYSPFYAEELVPGYHARVARIEGRDVAFTRDGRLCPFTTDRLADIVDTAVLRERPQLVLCLAVRGATPYRRGDVEPRPGAGNVERRDDAGARQAGAGDAGRGADAGHAELEAVVIDVLERDVRDPMAPADRYEILERFELPVVRHAGPFDAEDAAAMLAWVGELEAAGAAGAVLKPSERHHRPLKYSFPSTARAPLPAAEILSDEADPCRQRLLRAACAATELGRGPGDHDWAAVGEALLRPIARAAATVAEGGALREERAVRLRRRRSADALAAHLAELDEGVAVESVTVDALDDGSWRMRWVYSHWRATAELERRLSGASYRD